MSETVRDAETWPLSTERAEFQKVVVLPLQTKVRASENDTRHIQGLAELTE